MRCRVNVFICHPDSDTGNLVTEPLSSNGRPPRFRYSGFQRHATIYKSSVCTSQEIHYISATKPNWLLLFRETVAVYCESHTKHINTLCGQNAELLNVKAGGTYSYHYAWKY
jgi:hypothetical protein